MKTTRDIKNILKTAPIMAAAPLIGLLFVIAIPYIVVALLSAMAGAKLAGHALPGALGDLVIRHS